MLTKDIITIPVRGKPTRVYWPPEQRADGTQWVRAVGEIKWIECELKFEVKDAD